ncbi:competence protein CoiA [Serratia sp. DD3]|uniref:competence protein CoiA n=1 Tax=Serratia sp. DD3 TaxID=1410619 RepID=UPI0004D88208|nr:competence protein CoiA family protein [Serratia sp. DD3]KEY57131.1 competence protein [Serratia sp. DD3]
MLTGMRSATNGKVFAKNCEKKDGPFFCIGCQKELVLKKGMIKVHHFAHKPPSSCTRGQGETEKHRECKESIYNMLLTMSNVRDVDIEHDLGGAVADVYAVINNIPVAIEVQHSSLTVNEITRRTEQYNKLEVCVLWLSLFDERLLKDRFSPSAWEKWCHAAYYGRVYYWVSGLDIIPYHFSEYKLYVPEKTWHVSCGDERSAGGYHKDSKRYRKPLAGQSVNIARDFTHKIKSEWKAKKIHIPECRIYLDVQSAWWEKTAFTNK